MHQEITDDQLLRYARHIILDEVGEEGQLQLLNSKVLVVGAGRLARARRRRRGQPGRRHPVPRALRARRQPALLRGPRQFRVRSCSSFGRSRG